MAQWTYEEWDRKVRIAKQVPAELFADLLQSRFSVGPLLRFVAVRPLMWPRAARYGIRGALAWLSS